MAHGITSGVIGGNSMGSESSSKLPADAFEGSARTLVTRVRVEAPAKRLPGLEGMGQHQQLRLGVGCRRMVVRLSHV